MVQDLFNTFNYIVDSAQQSSAVHQKCLKQLRTLYEKTDEDEFVQVFEEYLQRILCMDYSIKNVSVERSIEFATLFVASINDHEEEAADNSDDSVESAFQTKILDYLIEIQFLDDNILRYRACQTLSILFDKMIGNSLSLEMCDKIQDAMLQRFEDGKVRVRLQAAITLFRVQSPENDQDAVIKSYISHMTYDPSGPVRKICVEKVALGKGVLKKLLRKSQDVDVNVRIAFYTRISRIPKYYRILQKQSIILQAFQDTSPLVVDYVTNQMLPMWLERYNNDYIPFLESFHLDTTEDVWMQTAAVIKLVITALFKTKSVREIIDVLQLGENRLIPINELSLDKLLLWQVLLELLRANDVYSDLLEEIQPELIYLVKYIDDYYNSFRQNPEKLLDVQPQFILNQFFHITSGYEFDDPVNRQVLNVLISNVLKFVPLKTIVINTIISNLNVSMPVAHDQITYVCELIGDIIQPMSSGDNLVTSDVTNGVTNDVNNAVTNDVNNGITNGVTMATAGGGGGDGTDYAFQMAQLRMQLHRLVDQQETAVQEKNYLEAAKCESEIAVVRERLEVMVEKMKEPELDPEVECPVVKKTDTETIFKYLDIAAAFLRSPKIRRLTPVLETLQTSVIAELLIHENPDIRAKALKCYAACCVLSKKSAEHGIHIFCAPIQAYCEGMEIDQESLKVSIMAMCDILICYKSEVISEPRVALSTSTTEEMERHFTGGCSLTNIAEGLVQLISNNEGDIHFYSTKALCLLILHGRVHSPSLIHKLLIQWSNPTITVDRSVDCARQLIGYFFEKLKYLKDSADLIQNAILPTIRTIVAAPLQSPLANINLDNLTKFLLQFCTTLRDGESIHENLAFTICNHLSNKPKSKYNLQFSKVLLSLNISNKMLVRELLAICDDLKSSIYDKATLLNVTKFNTRLHFVISNDVSTIQEEDEEKETNSDEVANN